MGVGDPLEASYTLAGPIAAGSWHLIGDGLILATVDVRFDVLWRSSAGDHVIATFTNHFVQPTGAQAFNAVLLDADAPGVAAAAVAGDLLVLRMTATASMASGPAYIPNADGPHTNGRIPSLTLP